MQMLTAVPIADSPVSRVTIERNSCGIDSRQFTKYREKDSNADLEFGKLEDYLFLEMLHF